MLFSKSQRQRKEAVTLASDGKNKAARATTRAAALAIESGYGWVLALIAAVIVAFLMLFIGLAYVVASSNTASAACTGAATGKDNTQKAYNYLMSGPEFQLKDFQAAGMVGNFIHESGGDPIKTHNPDPNSGADGIAHWYAERLTALKSHQFQGRDWTDIDLQLDYLRTELTGGYRSALVAVRQTTTIADATTTFERLFERSGNTASYQVRISNAISVLRRYGDPTVSLAADPLADPGIGLDACTAGGNGGIPGTVEIASTANYPGQPISQVTMGYLATVAGLYGKKLVVTIGTRHNVLTVNGNVSDHVSGHAADIGMAANGGTNDGPVGDAIMTACLVAAGDTPAQAAAIARVREGPVQTRVHNGLHIQCIWGTYAGGNHHDHVHIGARPA